MFGTTSTFATALLCAGVALLISPATGSAPAGDVGFAVHLQSSARDLSSTVVAQQLGVKLSPSQPQELVIGASLTGILTDPAKLALFGIANAGEGARVSVLRVAAQKLLVEVDEMIPEPRTRRATLRLREDGRLSLFTP